MTIETRELVAPSDAANRLNISYQRLRQLVKAGQLATITDSTGRQTFRVEDVEALRRARQERKAQEATTKGERG